METQTKITFWLNKAKSRKNKLSPIYLRVRYDYEYFVRSTGITVKESQWNKRLMRVKGGRDAESINSELDSLKHRIIVDINQLILSGKPFNLEIIKKKLDGEDEKGVSLLKVYNDFLSTMKKLEGKDYARATIVKYSNTKLRL